jgi:HAD superfamily hydrolase (TIGR01509 family)
VNVGALLFDLGGVVIDIDFGRALASWAAAAGVPVDTLRARFSFDDAYQRHERGEIEAAEYFAALRSSLRIDVPDAALVTGWNAIYVDEVPGMRALLATVADRFPLYAFTNSNRTHHAFSSARYADVLGTFRRVFVSFELGRRKPERAAFEAIAAAIGVPLDRILFFDDTPANVEGARAIGMRAVLVRTPVDVANALAAL